MVVSAHKMLPAFSQASLVLARSGRIDTDRLDRAFAATHTTSPSGAILASPTLRACRCSCPARRSRVRPSEPWSSRSSSGNRAAYAADPTLATLHVVTG